MGFLEKVRGSDNRTKFRYVAIFSGLVGVFVIVVWAMSLRGILEELNQPPTIESIRDEEESSFQAKILGAWDGIKERTKNTVEYFKGKLQETNEITIEN